MNNPPVRVFPREGEPYDTTASELKAGQRFRFKQPNAPLLECALDAKLVKQQDGSFVWNLNVKRVDEEAPKLPPDQCEDWIWRTDDLANTVRAHVEALNEIKGVDQRFFAVACTYLQLGFMAMRRSIERPETF